MLLKIGSFFNGIGIVKLANHSLSLSSGGARDSSALGESSRSAGFVDLSMRSGAEIELDNAEQPTVPMQSTRRMQEGVRFLWREGQRAIFGERASRNVRFGYRLLPLILVRHAHDLRLELIAAYVSHLRTC
jgi:hypothetical protein